MKVLATLVPIMAPSQARTSLLPPLGVPPVLGGVPMVSLVPMIPMIPRPSLVVGLVSNPRRDPARALPLVLAH